MTFDIYGDRAVEAMALIREFARVEYWDYFKGDPERALEAFCVMQDAAEAKSAARIAELDAQLGKRPCQNNRCTNLVAANIRIAELEAQVSALKAAGGVPDELRAIGQLLRTQDEQCTADAMFVVEQKRLIIGFDTDYSQGPEDIVWCIEDHNIFQGDEEFAELERAYEEDGTIPENYSRHGFAWQWAFITAFFTDKDSAEFVERHGHKYEGELRVTVECEVRNRQWAAMRKWLMSLAAPQAAEQTKQQEPK
jgi:hypothetical protein